MSTHKDTMRIVKSDPPETTEIMAAAVVKISDGFAKLTATGLNRRAVAVLIHDKTKLGIGTIETVLDALPRLKGWYCR